MGKVVGGVFAAALFSLTTMAQAAIVTETLDNVTFNDGGTASGFFEFDPANLGVIPNFDIKTTAGTSITTAFEYTPGNSTTQSTDTVFLFSDNSGQRLLKLVFASPLSAAGGPAAVFTNGPTPDSSLELIDSGAAIRFTTGGSVNGVVAAVPEPATFAFLGLGLGAVLLLRKRLS